MVPSLHMVAIVLGLRCMRRRCSSIESGTIDVEKDVVLATGRSRGRSGVDVIDPVGSWFTCSRSTSM